MSSGQYQVTVPDPEPYHYEQEVYQKGLRHERPPVTFDAIKWEPLAKERLSADSWGYVWGRPEIEIPVLTDTHPFQQVLPAHEKLMTRISRHFVNGPSSPTAS